MAATRRKVSGFACACLAVLTGDALKPLVLQLRAGYAAISDLKHFRAILNHLTAHQGPVGRRGL
jgi:hypothetical protein